MPPLKSLSQIKKKRPPNAERVEAIKRGLLLEDALQRMREDRGVTQAALAERLAVSRPNIGRIEAETDVRLSTLRRYVEALGGQLEVRAVFSDGDVPLVAAERTAAMENLARWLAVQAASAEGEKQVADELRALGHDELVVPCRTKAGAMDVGRWKALGWTALGALGHDKISEDVAKRLFAEREGKAVLMVVHDGESIRVQVRDSPVKGEARRGKRGRKTGRVVHMVKEPGGEKG